ncbi:MAG: homocitrate synthase/isopropylmalate synthase family protein, partial [Acidimicrobiales bacterium]
MSLELYDTTLRDGAQGVGINFSVGDKLRVVEHLDRLGVDVIEGGWPGANETDTEFFATMRGVRLQHATLAAFGATCRAGVAAADDLQLRALHSSGAPIITLVGKTWDRQVGDVLRTTTDENLRMIHDSVAWLASSGHRVFFDAEHFFDGHASDADYALRCLEAAAGGGAERVALCDTNGGTLPHEVEAVVGAVRAAFPGIQLGLHFHNDSGCAVANTLAGVRAGATQVQGCVNGYGERAGNADLSAAIPNLALKMGVRAIPPDRLERLTPVAHHLAELVNVPPGPQQPYVGTSAFAHKAGLHTSAIARRPDAYEHVPPDAVGNG